jgi:hypothetical protein
MNYLDPSEYEAHGLEATTPLAWVTSASTMIDAYCRRVTLAVAQYEERLRLAEARNSTRVTYLPLTIVDPATTPIVSAQGRYATPRRGEWPLDDVRSQAALLFGLPNTWIAIDPAAIDVYPETGELRLPVNVLGLAFSEVDVVYTAGLSMIPDSIKTACAQIVRNAQATPALNVRTSHMDRMHMQYFSDTLVDQMVRSLLAPYVAQKVG